MDGLTLTDNGQLNWRLSYADNETSYSLIAGYGRTPQVLQTRYQLTSSPTTDADIPAADSESVNVPGQYAETEIAGVQTLEDVESGWLYIEDKDIILVKYLHPAADVRFEIF